MEKAKLEAAATAKRQQEEDRITHMLSLVVAGTAGDVGQTLGLAIVPSRPESALDRLAAERLPEVLARAAPDSVRVIPAMFTDGFVKEGYFASAFAGDPTPLKESEALTRARWIALGQIETACAPNNSVQGVTNCRIALSLKVFGKDGKIIDTEHLTEIGPNFSEQAAVVRGVELLVERSGSRVLQVTRRQE